MTVRLNRHRGFPFNQMSRASGEQWNSRSIFNRANYADIWEIESACARVAGNLRGIIRKSAQCVLCR